MVPIHLAGQGPREDFGNTIKSSCRARLPSTEEDTLCLARPSLSSRG
jgi:hypothetical protein